MSTTFSACVHPGRAARLGQLEGHAQRAARWIVITSFASRANPLVRNTLASDSASETISAATRGPAGAHSSLAPGSTAVLALAVSASSYRQRQLRPASQLQSC